ncbi:hypothetical protein BUE93_21990 [Chromobacterium amazonense]|uniref:Uncharacterized protein n=1 Tax=Chromobacterium amazonense TaxID=1382803 RepID=A0A2S9WYK9_9NEIS|nr:hypothetical protein [Chromobacterium amazonense]PRP68476.1 hypothetical protein BUE93_21990 [Chromobacterium amazonense]
MKHKSLAMISIVFSLITLVIAVVFFGWVASLTVIGTAGAILTIMGLAFWFIFKSSDPNGG